MINEAGYRRDVAIAAQDVYLSGNESASEEWIADMIAGYAVEREQLLDDFVMELASMRAEDDANDTGEILESPDFNLEEEATPATSPACGHVRI